MNILIVEDDTLIRNWLSMLLDQLNQDIKIFEASDGVEALEICKTEEINLVITDIVMPRMDGLELIKKLKENYPHVRTSVLSSYDDFEYVRLALKLGALDYIPKAEMKIEDISDLLGKARKDFEMEVSMSTDILKKEMMTKKIVEEFQNYIADKDEQEEAILNLTKPPLDDKSLCISIFLMESQKQSLNSQTVAKICKDTLEGEVRASLVFPWDQEYFVIIYNYTSSVIENQREEYQKIIATLDSNIERYTGVPISSSVNMIVNEDETIRAIFNNLLNILEIRSYYETNIDFSILDETKPSRRKEMVEELQRLLSTGKLIEAVEKIKIYLAAAHELYILPNRIKSLVVAGINVFLTSATLMESKYGEVDKLSKFLYTISTIKTKTHMEETLGSFCDEYLKIVDEAMNAYSPPIKMALDYINENYSQKIVLDDVADHIYHNRSYVSQLFKKEVGISFGDYLEKLRIDNAKHLIRSTDKSMSEVAELVGYSSQNYFARIFKKATGVSPFQYRKKQI